MYGIDWAKGPARFSNKQNKKETTCCLPVRTGQTQWMSYVLYGKINAEIVDKKSTFWLKLVNGWLVKNSGGSH